MTYPTRTTAIDAVKTLIAFIGDDPERPGLKETPDRVLKAWRADWGAGYGTPPSNLVKLFDAEEEVSDLRIELPPLPMVVVRDLTFHSTCEHHLAPFFGGAAIAYIPQPERGRLGLSKFARIIDYFSHRLQVQERLTDEIADFLVEHLSPDVAVTMSGTHMCMVSRGVRQSHAKTITTALRGAFYNESVTRQEFFGACS